MKKSESTKLVAVLIAAYPAGAHGRKIEQETVELYETYLCDFDASVTGRVIDDLIKTSKWFPAISEIRREVVRRRVGAPSTAGAIAQLVEYSKHFAGLARNDVRHTRKDRRPPEIHPIARKAMNLCGGMSSYGKSTAPALWQSQFRKSYEELVADATFEENVNPRAALPSAAPVRELGGLNE